MKFTRQARDSRIRKELRETGRCRRGPFLVKKLSPKGYHVSIVTPEGSFKTVDVNEVVTHVISIEHGYCTACPYGEEHDFRCFEEGSCGQFPVPTETKGKKKAREPTYVPDAPTWTNLDKLARILLDRPGIGNSSDADCLRRAYGILTRMLGEAFRDGNEEVASLLGYTTQECAWSNHDGVRRTDAPPEPKTHTLYFDPVPRDLKIRAIKILREATGLGLKESKEGIEGGDLQGTWLATYKEAERAATYMTLAGFVTVADVPPPKDPLGAFEHAWDCNKDWIFQTVVKEHEKLGQQGEVTAWVQYQGGEFYLHTGTKPVQHGRFGLWATVTFPWDVHPKYCMDSIKDQLKEQALKASR